MQNSILIIEDDFSLSKIVNSGQCFRAKELQDGWFQFISGSKVFRVKQVEHNGFLANWDKYWCRYFDLDSKYSDIKINDQFMKKSYEFGKGIRILRQDPWETIISFIISQRKSIPAIKTSIERLCKNFGNQIEDEIFAFPSPKQLFMANFSKLKECGLGYRINYVMDVARYIFTEDIDLEKWNSLDTEELISKLLSLKGVGPKVANCVALFAYGRKECAPIDTWIDKAIKLHYNGENPFVAYKDQAGLMQQYVFYYMIKTWH